jgi:hypothetical protein
MRRQLIEALSFPGLLVKQLIEGGNYPHKNLYGSGNCNWDHCLEDFTHRDQKSLEELGESLREGIKLVESLHSHLRHDETTCTCETCSWIRNAEHLTEEIEHHLPHVEPDLHNFAHDERTAE